MLSRLLLPIMLLSALCAAQPQEPVTTQKVLEELKSMRTFLNHIVQMIETLEKGQKGQLALARIQIDEDRVATLEAQRLTLLSREQDLGRDIGEATAALRVEEGGPTQMLVQSPTGVPEAVSRSGASPASMRLAQSRQAVDETRRSRQAIEQQIAVLRSRIDRMEKYLEEAMR